MKILVDENLLVLLLASGLAACRATSPAPSSATTASADPPRLEPPASAQADPTPAVPAACLSIERRDAEGRCVPACPAGEVYVPATGPDGFVMGSGKVPFAFGTFALSHRPHAIGDEPHRVVLTQPFCMDATEVTVGAYDDCVDRRRCAASIVHSRWSTTRKRRDLPIDTTDHMMADDYCHGVGKELPTEAQWVWAATGGDGRAYPWGDDRPTCAHADFTDGPLSGPVGDYGCRGGGPSPVGSTPLGDKVWPAGRIHDLAGNVWEWVLDAYHPFGSEPVVDPLDAEVSGLYGIRGGGWNRSAAGIRTDMRGGEPADYQRPGLGFRCARNPDPPSALAEKLELLHRRERARYGHRRGPNEPRQEN